MHPAVFDALLNELNEIGLHKEAASIGTLRRVAKTRRLLRKVRSGVTAPVKAVAKIPDAVEEASRKAYVSSPEWAQKAHLKAMQMANEDAEGVAGYARPLLKMFGG
jgi:hypothetical protein